MAQQRLKSLNRGCTQSENFSESSIADTAPCFNIECQWSVGNISNSRHSLIPHRLIRTANGIDPLLWRKHLSSARYTRSKSSKPSTTLNLSLQIGEFYMTMDIDKCWYENSGIKLHTLHLIELLPLTNLDNHPVT